MASKRHFSSLSLGYNAPVFLMGLLVVVNKTATQAEEMTSLPRASREYTFLAGYGITHQGFGATRTQVQMVDAIGRFGYFISDELGKGWYRGRHELFIEVPLHLAVDPQTTDNDAPSYFSR